MPKVQTITTNFTAGEFSPLLSGRVDLEKYGASAKLMRNVVVLKQGGFTIRPPLDFQGEVKTSTQTARIIPFIYSRTDAYILEFGNQYMRVWRGGALVESAPGVPYEIATPYTDADLRALDFSQGADTMILAHGSHATRRLRRFADNRWVMDEAPFKPAAVDEIGFRGTATLTLSDGTVGAGRTITASAATFLAADVGRELTWDGGVALITAFTSSTSVTVTVTTPFATLVAATPTWRLMGSPQTTNTPSGTAVGSTITMTLMADGWRSTEVGGLVEINGGLVEITQYTSPTVVSGLVKRELTSGTGAVADSWVLKVPIWNAVDGYPETCTFHQQRLWLANTRTYPQSAWGSVSGLYFDFTPGTDDDSAVYKTAAGDEVNPIQFLVSMGSLLMLGYGVEFEGKGGVEKPITQTNMQINPQSEWGCEKVRPATAGKDVLFIERGGTALRALFPQQVDGYDSNDVSIYSEHLLRLGLKCISYERRPNSMVWACDEAGALLAFTYNREQNTIAWASGSTDGVVEWLATVPNNTGKADVTFALVRRTINGLTKRYVEKLNWFAVRGKYDSRKALALGSPASVWGGFDHLIGKTVNVTADDIFIGQFVIPPSGQITLETPALTISAGLPYEAKVIVQAPEVGTGTGTSQAQSQSTNHIWVKLLDSVGMKINGEEVPFRDFDTNVLDLPVPSFTGLKDLLNYGWEEGESDIELVQDQGMPWTVLALIRNFTVNAS